MSTNIELVDKALALLNDVPFGHKANDVVLVIRELKSNLLYKEAGDLVAVKVNAPIIKLDNVEVVKPKRGRKLGSKVAPKAKKSEVAAVPLEDSIVGEAVETLAQKAKKLKG